jgi:hypothetical protein
MYGSVTFALGSYENPGSGCLAALIFLQYRSVGCKVTVKLSAVESIGLAGMLSDEELERCRSG